MPEAPKEIGYYWVDVEADDHWEVAAWDGNLWTFCVESDNQCLGADRVAIIGPRIQKTSELKPDGREDRPGD